VLLHHLVDSASNEITLLNCASSIESRWGHHFELVEVFREGFPSRVGGDGNSLARLSSVVFVEEVHDALKIHPVSRSVWPLEIMPPQLSAGGGTPAPWSGHIIGENSSPR
jgi:hypothetical protein